MTGTVSSEVSLSEISSRHRTLRPLACPGAPSSLGSRWPARSRSPTRRTATVDTGWIRLPVLSCPSSKMTGCNR
jgi:hypothetical protein